MKTFCETFSHWLYHPVDTSLLCEKRARRLSECTRCKGVEIPTAMTLKREEVSKVIILNVDKNNWIEVVRELREQYDIREGGKKDETSARRIAILVGELYLTKFGRGNPKALFNMIIVEKDAYNLAIEYRMTCDPLENEEGVKPDMRKNVLCTWGVDKTSGVEGYITQLKEWTVLGLLGELNEPVRVSNVDWNKGRKCLKYDLNITQCSRWIGREPQKVCQECLKELETAQKVEEVDYGGEVDFGSRAYETFGLEEAGVG